MTLFWLAVVAMLLATAGFIFWPLIVAAKDAQDVTASAQDKRTLRNTPARLAIAAASHKQRNIEIFKERLQELQAEVAQGNLEAAAFEQLKIELEKSLLNDMSFANLPVAAEPVRITTKHWLVGVLMFLAVIIWSVGLYALLGRPDDYSIRLAMQAQGMPTDINTDAPQATAQSAPDLTKAIELLKQKVKEDPTNLSKWFLLANSYAATQQYDKSAETFLAIEKIVPKDSPEYAAVKGSYAQALYLANDEKITVAVQAAIAETLAIDAQEPNALVLKGVEAYEKDAFKEAIGYWEQAKRRANANLTEQFIDPSIRVAQEKLGITPSSTTGKTMVAAQSNTAKITVTVAVAPELRTKVQDEQVVFVFARPAGSKMPLAAERIKVSDLPATITLDDSKAAMPTAVLSSVSEVDITARISLSGQPMPQAGDLFATQEHVKVQGAAPVTLTINQVVGDAAPVTPFSAIATAPVALQVRVDISPELKAKASPEQTVFIFAKQPGGKMPLAVERVMVKDLPKTVVLDDSKAAMPTAKLSSASAVDVSARVSFSGQAMQQSGDFQGIQSQIDLKQVQQPVKLLIDQVVP